jgi:hypothetical protein
LALFLGRAPQSLKKKSLIFYCTQTWPEYQLGDGEKWPPEGSINYNPYSNQACFADARANE